MPAQPLQVECMSSLCSLWTWHSSHGKGQLKVHDLTIYRFHYLHCRCCWNTWKCDKSKSLVQVRGNFTIFNIFHRFLNLSTRIFLVFLIFHWFSMFVNIFLHFSWFFNFTILKFLDRNCLSFFMIFLSFSKYFILKFFR